MLVLSRKIGESIVIGNAIPEPGFIKGDGGDVAGFRAAINCLIADGRTSGGPEIEFCDDLADDELRPVLQLAVLSIVRELLSNTRRHSRSEKVLLGLTQDGGHLCIQVQDWGLGFDPHSVSPYKRGLKGIRDLAGWLGGTVRIDSQKDTGTCVMVEVPLLPEAD